jgi:hypothetical protein
MELKITIKLDNAAFEKAPSCDIEASRILQEFAKSLYFCQLEEGKGNLRDINGNKVGEWEISE